MENAQAKNNIFFVHYKDKNELYQHYMQFVENGGLFVATEKTLHLGDEVFLMVKLIDEPEKFTIAGKVIWIMIGLKKWTQGWIWIGCGNWVELLQPSRMISRCRHKWPESMKCAVR